MDQKLYRTGRSAGREVRVIAMENTTRKASAAVAIVAGFALLIHVVMGVVIVLSPEVSAGNRILTFYRRFVVLGPFFSEPTIAGAPHLYVSYHSGGSWNKAVDYACHDVAQPHRRYSAAKRRAFEEYLVKRMEKVKDPRSNATAVRELEGYLFRQEMPQGTDSIRVTIVRTSVKRDTPGTDTVRVYAFARQ